MEIKQGDIIQDDYSKDIWMVLDTTERSVIVECLDEGDTTTYNNNYLVGQRRDFPYNYSGWRVLPRKSLNFNNLYEKLQGRG